MLNTPYDNLTNKILDCDMAVHREQGSGLREDTYHRSLSNHLSDASISFKTEKLYSVYDDSDQERLVGYYIPDFVVKGKVIVEIKTIQGLEIRHLAQIISYLAVSRLPVGLSSNFREQSVRYLRVFPHQKVIDHLLNHQWLFIPEWLKNKGTKE